MTSPLEAACVKHTDSCNLTSA